MRKLACTSFSYLIISVIISFFTGCGEDNVINNHDTSLLYSSDEIVCDFNDSTTIRFDTTVYPVYMKTLLVHITDRSFPKIKISGTVDSFYVHDSLGGQNPIVIMGVVYDTVNQYVGDTLTYYHGYKGQFLNITPVTYPEGAPYFILFSLEVAEPARGDFIRIKDLRIYKSF